MRRIPRLSRTTLARSACLMALLLSTTAAACSGDKGAAQQANAAPVSGTVASTRTPTYTFEVVRTYPHDPSAYTEGLMFHDGRFFESTGEVGKSDIREVELETGRVIRKRPLTQKDKNDSGYFGEGIAIVDDRILELTWKSGVAFIYDWKTFEPKGQFKYEGEGWAFTKSADSLIMSNGSAVLNYRDPKTFAITRSLTVTDHDVPVSNLNELEWVKGEIWANVWTTDQIARIDPKTGKVLGWINLAGLLEAADKNGNEDVLNGIAYDEKADRIFVTGKRWSKLYEIKLKQRS
ncbi:MAG: glutaminyl-peptide cyclotransferase [Gemmatimonadaceae bacterium]